ncbi:MAG: hypothetical protein HGJ98_09695 [Desulfosporosinus sp.]|nr:hypothetical protein [Desulfosporosinus sp.]MBC2726741.1 hypothetical protein [Desulfosporosinus sp.]
MMIASTDTTHNTALPQLCQDACGWDAAVMPKRSTTYRAKAAPRIRQNGFGGEGKIQGDCEYDC